LRALLSPALTAENGPAWPESRFRLEVKLSAPVLWQPCTRFVAILVINSLIQYAILAPESMNLRELEHFRCA
jgi:hypothetical protein